MILKKKNKRDFWTGRVSEEEEEEEEEVKKNFFWVIEWDKWRRWWSFE